MTETNDYSDEKTVDFDENFTSEQDLRDIETLLVLSKTRDVWEFDIEALNRCSSLKQILLQCCNHKLFLFDLELVKPKVVSFCCESLRKHVVFKSDVNLKPRNSNMLEFIDSIQLIFCPRLESMTFIINQGDSLNLHMVIKLND